MAWQVIFSARSKRDLQDIVEYIARDNPAAAERVGLLLIEQADALANTPEMGPVLPQRLNVRFFPVGSYLIIYRADEEACCANSSVLVRSTPNASDALKVAGKVPGRRSPDSQESDFKCIASFGVL
jgi:plasmid stabilization system protein ParE